MFEQLGQPLAEICGRALRVIPPRPMRVARLRTRRARMARDKGDPLKRNAATFEPVGDRAERAARLARSLVDDDVMRFAGKQPALELGSYRDAARKGIAVRPQRHWRRSTKGRGNDCAKRRSDAANADHAR